MNNNIVVHPRLLRGLAAAGFAIAAAISPLSLRAAGDDAGPAHDGEWIFEAMLDGKPIGEHRFTAKTEGGERHVRSVASFDVKLLGFTAYRYRHEADERWRSECLAGLKATTDDDGKRAEVVAERRGESLTVTSPGGTETLSGCVMTYAYWNPAIQRESHLLDPQTGRYDAVRIESMGDGTLAVRGQQLSARRVRIARTDAPIDVWYTVQGDWVGLDSTVNGRKLSYRLK